MAQTIREQVAAFRYSLIAPVVSRQTPMTPGELGAFLREVSERAYTIPGSTHTQVSVRTLERFLAMYRQGGYDALMPKERRDKGQCKLTGAVVAQAAALEQIIFLLEESGLVERGTVAQSTLARHLRQAGLSRKALLKPAPSGKFRRFEAADVHVLWQADFKHALYLPDPQTPGRKKKAILFAILDDYSRLVVHGQFYFDEKMPRLEDSLKKAILHHGIPEQLYVDNGAVFSSHHLERICGRLGIHLSHSRPYRPEGRGKIERIFQFVDSSFLPEAYAAIEAGHIATLEDLNKAFHAWVEGYYHVRRHGTTGKTPKERTVQSERKPRRVSEAALTEVFFWQEERKVDKAGCVSLNGNVYEVDGELSGDKVQLRYDPFDLSSVQVWRDGKRFENARPIDLTRSQDVRVQEPETKDPRRSAGTSFFAALEERRRREAEAEPVRYSEMGGAAK